MTLNEFLTVAGGEYIRVCDGNINNVVYDADKYAIRANHAEYLDREIYRVHPVSKTRFEVLIK